ncbi:MULTISPECIES: alpha/beta fold hydrolase [unclassified Halomonas]|uniref:alpha/beta fold hydrolase n=1 Tax=unclassified Halomonas TaxID=2609666 RepID=UPI0009C34602|nr:MULTISPECIES: alpha/beta fold hydrolase [unclassified Halomonas]AQU81190.1 dienelactone hydrolase [Halomonas sp. 'Soap Lake \
MSFYAELGFVNVTASELPNAMDSRSTQRFMVDGYGPLAISGVPEYGRMLFVHGAGAGQASMFMRHFVARVASLGVQVLTIDLPYMQQINEQGRRRPPPPIKHTLAQVCAWYELLLPLGPTPLWVGGKSMGGRIATMLASSGLASPGLANSEVASPEAPLANTDIVANSPKGEALAGRVECPGVIVAGYPFHPPKQPNKLRLAHFPGITAPVLILQGERDPFGSVDDVADYSLPSNVQLKWLQDGDHDLKPRRASGLKHAVLIDEAATIAASFVRAHHK